LAGIFVIFGKVFISFSTGFAGYVFISYYHPIHSKVASIYLPIIFMIIIGFGIANMFMNVYG